MDVFMIYMACLAVAVGSLIIGLSIGYVIGRKPLMDLKHANDKYCPHGYADWDKCPVCCH